ncbi:hypothetical protein STEG23_009759, partial [Scotinomys teguina]
MENITIGSTKLTQQCSGWLFQLSLEVPPPLMFPMTDTLLGRDHDCSLNNREPDVPGPWFLDPGGWSKTSAVRLYFIFPGMCTLSLHFNKLLEYLSDAEIQFIKILKSNNTPIAHKHHYVYNINADDLCGELSDTEEECDRGKSASDSQHYNFVSPFIVLNQRPNAVPNIRGYIFFFKSVVNQKDKHGSCFSLSLSIPILDCHHTWCCCGTPSDFYCATQT